MIPSETTNDVTNAGSSDHTPSPAEASSATVTCSICLEFVIDHGDRSVARLPCDHRFHLDCIGSAFNSKGAMQCPNCRRIESGRWLYANGSAGASSQVREWAAAVPHEMVNPRVPTIQWRQVGGFNGHSSPEEMEASQTASNFAGSYVSISAHLAAVAAASARFYNSIANFNLYPPLYINPALSNYFHSTHPPVGSTHAWPQPTYYNTPRPVSRSRETPVTNSQSHERNHIRHQIPQTTSHHEQPSVFTITSSSASSMISSGSGLLHPIISPNLTHQPNVRGVHGHGVRSNETDSDESSHVPGIRGTYNSRRP